MTQSLSDSVALPKTVAELSCFCRKKSMQEIAKAFFSALQITSIESIDFQIQSFRIGEGKEIQVGDGSRYMAIFLRILAGLQDVTISTDKKEIAFVFSVSMVDAAFVFFGNDICNEAIKYKGFKHKNLFDLLMVKEGDMTTIKLKLKS